MTEKSASNNPKSYCKWWQEADRLQSLLPALRERLGIEKQMTEYGKLGKAYQPGDFDRDMALKHKAEGAGISTTPEIAAEQAKATEAQIDAIVAEATQTRMEATKSAIEASQADTPKDRAPKAAHVSPQSFADIAAQKREEGASLGELVLYWENVVATTGKYHEQLLRAEEAFQKEIAEKGKIKPMLAKEQVGPEPAPLPIDFMQHKETEAEADERINKALEAQEKHAANIYESTMKVAEFKEKMGQISPSQAAAQETAASRTQENTDVTALQAQQKAIAPMGPIGLDDKMLAEWQKLQEQITAAQEKGSQQRQMIAQQEALRQEQQFQKMFSAMTTPMNSFFDHWLTSGQRMGVAFQRMYDQMAMAVINAEMRMLEKHLAVELQKRFATLASNTAQTASTVGANAVKQASDTTTATQSISKKAADAAAGAWNALSNIPVVGPVLGAAAAAATWTGVMALAAFEQGGIIPGSIGSAVPILGHAGEAVLPQPLTAMLTNAAQGGGGPNGGVHFHDHSNFTGIDGASVAGMARNHGATFRRESMRQLRLMNKI